MRKIIVFASGITALLLMATLIVASVQIRIDYLNYGSSYEVITIKDGVETRSTVYFSMNILTLAFFMWLTFLLIAPLVDMLHQKRG